MPTDQDQNIKMEYITIGIVALFASLLTLFSGFGLGTLLTPVFAIFFPVEYAVGMTAIVHFLNNLFKLGLLGKHIDYTIILKFGLPSILGALIGAYLLIYLSDSDALFEYEFLNKTCEITWVKLCIAFLMIFFSLFELIPSWSTLEINKGYLFPGGILSGFFGGLSGHQGALRSAFLIRYKLSKEIFIATGVAIACLVDLTRLPIYITELNKDVLSENYKLLLFTVFCAFTGAFIGSKLLKKTTFKTVQSIVGIMIILIGILIGLGII